MNFINGLFDGFLSFFNYAYGVKVGAGICTFGAAFLIVTMVVLWVAMVIKLVIWIQDK